MIKYIVKRIGSLFMTLWVISILMFGLMKLMPQDPVALAMPTHNKVAQQEIVYEQIKEELGLNDSYLVQYSRWIQRLCKGDLGTSIVYKQPVKDVIALPLINTLRLNAVVLIISFLLALCGGLLSAFHPGGIWDRFWQSFTLFGMSIPGFFFALILIHLFAFQWHLFPSSGTWQSQDTLLQNLSTMVLPVSVLSMLSFCTMERYLRDCLINVLHQEYMIGYRARGASTWKLMRHALHGCLLPIITLIMNEISMLLIGSVIIEYVFAYDGIGRVLLTALDRRDDMLAIALNFLYAGLYLVCNLCADVCYLLADPRVKHL